MYLLQVSRRKAEEELGDGEVREMITPMLRESLEKQGYRLIGSHSGVKLCRWTKVRALSVTLLMKVFSFYLYECLLK